MLDNSYHTETFDNTVLRAMVDNAVDGIIAIDLQGTVLMINPAVERLFGYQAGEVLGRNINMLMPEPYHDEHDEYLRRYTATGHRTIIGIGREVAGRRKDGTIFPMYLSVGEVRYGNQRYFTGIVHDLSELKRATRELQRMRSYLKNIIDSMPSILVGVDRDGVITEWNQEAERYTGVPLESAVGANFAELFPHFGPQQEKLQEALHKREPVRTERLPVTDGGDTRFFDVVVYPLFANGSEGAVIRIDDVTQRVRIEQTIAQTEKMMSVGGLAAGMAHEINNPLSGVLQSAQNIRRRVSLELPTNQRIAERLGVDLGAVHAYLKERGIFDFLDGIGEAAGRASRIVNDMLTFSRRGDAYFAPAGLNGMLDTVLRLADSDYDLRKKYDFRKIRIVRDYDAALTMIHCDKSQIEQVFLNIIKNAAQALAGSDVADQSITVRTRKEGEYANIDIIDNGPGMEERVLRRVMEPFFTTKPVGEGTGLGLSVSYFIVTEEHKGSISATSTVGKGTMFTVRLPIRGKTPA